jgi:hypothetical protein
MNDSPESDDDPEPHPVLYPLFGMKCCTDRADQKNIIIGRMPVLGEYRSGGPRTLPGSFQHPARVPDNPVLVAA